MSTGGWIFLGVSWGLAAVFVIYCFAKIFGRG